ncbi:MAG: DUF1292 domain-containing protein [Bacillota bacterium]
METEDRIVTLIDEEGEAFDFIIVDCFTVEEQEYAIMVPLQDDEEDEDDAEGDEEFVDGNAGEYDSDFLDDDGEINGEDLEEEEAVIFRLCRDDEGQTSFQLIEDEEEWQRVSTIAFERLYKAEE